MRPSFRWLVTLSALSVPFTLTHVIEDFSVGIHQRFGLPLLTAASLVSLGYAAQVAGAALSARDDRRGHLLNLAVALAWFFGAVLDHLGEVLFVPIGQYRAGTVSKALEVGIILISVGWAALAFDALRGSSRAIRPRARTTTA